MKKVLFVSIVFLIIFFSGCTEDSTGEAFKSSPKKVNGATPPPSCTDGETRACTTIDSCPGTQTCVNGSWGACVDNPNDSCPCNEVWECGPWSECIGGTQARVCWDIHQCETEDEKPSETQDCTAGYNVRMNNVWITTIPNPEGGLDGPSPIGLNAYIRRGPPHQVLYGDDVPPTGPVNPDWVSLEFDLMNLSTDPSGDSRPITEFRLEVHPYGLSLPAMFDVFYSWDANQNQYTDATGVFAFGRIIHYSIPLDADGISNSIRELQVREIPIYIEVENLGVEDILYDANFGAGANPNVEVYDANYSCIESWSCGAWGTCVNGIQSRGCWDNNDCGTTIDQPALTRTCLPENENIT